MKFTPEIVVRHLASKGYGWEDICVKLNIRGDWVRRVVLDVKDQRASDGKHKGDPGTRATD